MLKSIKNSLFEIINILKPYTNRAYLVGGATRDILMNKTPNDFDIEIYDIDVQTFEKIMNKIGAKGVGKNFFVYKYKNFDLSLPRIENKNGYGHKGFNVKITQNEKEASLRRDFTINSIMINIFDGKIIDFWNGQKDIQNKIIRLIDEKKFKEDSLRVLRAMQFSSRLKFKIEKNTLQICKNINLSDLSNDRIYKEFEKMFYSKYLYYGFYYFIKMDIDIKIFNKKFCFWKLWKKFTKNPHPNYFLYHLNIKSKIFPKKYQKFPIKKPKIITNRFLYALSLKYPLKDFSILNENCCKEWLIKNNIYEKKYKPKHIDFLNPRKSILQEIKNYDKIIIKKDCNVCN